MFLTFLSPVELKVKTTFFSIVNLNGKLIMDVVNQLFPAKNITQD